MSKSRYPKNWKELAHSVKEAANWRCQRCNLLCYKTGEKPEGVTRSERAIRTLNVHHRNHNPEDNRLENLIAVCTTCHLAMHTRRNGSTSPGQLSLWQVNN